MHKTMDCPVYYCIGNHDLVKGNYGEELYGSIYGPTWYSFDVATCIMSLLPSTAETTRPITRKGMYTTG